MRVGPPLSPASPGVKDALGTSVSSARNNDFSCLWCCSICSVLVFDGENVLLACLGAFCSTVGLILGGLREGSQGVVSKNPKQLFFVEQECVCVFCVC